MAIVTATNIRKGQMVAYEGGMYRVHDINHVTAGRGRGHIQAKLRKVPEGSMHDQRLRPEEKIEILHIDRVKMSYMYTDGHEYTFMNNETYEQVTIPEELLGDDVLYLVENIEVEVDFHDGTPIGVDLPTTVELEIVSTDPGLRGATASASKKPAKTNTGLVVPVPQFIEIGERIRVNTADGTYVDRAK